MSASNNMETNILKLVFTNTTFALIGDATGLVGSGAAGSLYISLHTSDPGEAGDQTTSESAYTNYVRVAVARTTGGWTVASGAWSNAAAITFAACGVTGSTITHFGIGTASSGAGVLLFSGTCSLVVSSGITPAFAIGACSGTAD